MSLSFVYKTFSSNMDPINYLELEYSNWNVLSPSVSTSRVIPFTNLSLCNTYTNLLCDFDTLEKDQGSPPSYTLHIAV